MPETQVAKTIVVVTLPDESRALIRDAVGLEAVEDRRDNLKQALAAHLFDGDVTAWNKVGESVQLLSANQVDLLLGGLEHAVDDELWHHASVHFLELKSEYELEGVGLEIRDDTVMEEKLFGPLRVMFVTWLQPQA